MKTRQVTMAQALVGFLKNQYVERDGHESPFFAGAWGIFGHGIIAGLGQALQQNPDFRYYLSRNEQASVHIATAFAKARHRLATFACISSIGPGATNMIRVRPRPPSIAFLSCCFRATSSRGATWRRCCSN